MVQKKLKDQTARFNNLNTEGQSTTLVYVDATQGWKVVNTNEIQHLYATGNPLFITATGGACNTLVTAPCCGNYKIATFTGPGTFTVSQMQCSNKSSWRSNSSCTLFSSSWWSWWWWCWF